MKKYARIAITGYKGILGSSLRRSLEKDCELFLIDLPDYDITDRETIRKALKDFSPELVIHCAAYTAVDKAESEPETAFKVNSLATRYIAETCLELNAHLIYFSTDYVFCDSPGKDLRREFDIPAPRGVYACSKFGGEVEIRSILPFHYIIRTSWLYGGGGKNFVETIINAGKEKPFLKVVSDQIGTPTFADDLTTETLRLADSGIFGTYHISGNGACSWYEFAREILKAAGIKTRIYPISTAEYNAPAPRPEYSVLDNFALRNTIGDKMPHWKTSMIKFIDDLKKAGKI